MRHSKGLRGSAGFSLIELMIGVTLGLVILAALTSFFVSTSSNRHEIERTSRQIENGRFAIDTLRNELHLAGFYAELQQTGATWQTPDPCDATIAGTGFLLAPLQIPLPVFGYTPDVAIPGCVTDQVKNTDVLVIHRFNTETVPVGGAAGNEFYFQPSRCRNDSTTTPWAFGPGGSGSFTLRKIDCATPADLYRHRVALFYLRTWSLTPADNIPTLVRLEYAAGAVSVVPLVEGIQDLRFEYGIDTTGDGAPDEYRRCDTKTPCDLTQWSNVTSVRANVLAQNLEDTLGYDDVKEYDMGSGDPRAVGPFKDHRKRHVYAAVVSLVNRIGPREGS